MKKGKLRVLAGMMGAVLVWTEILSVGIRVSAAGEGTVVVTEVAVQDEESTEDTVDYAAEETEDWKSENSTEKEEAQEGVPNEEESVGGEAEADSVEQEGEKQDEEETGKMEGDIGQDGSETGEGDSISGETEQETVTTDSNMDGEVFENETGTENAARRLESMVSADDIASGTYEDVAWVIDVNGKLTVEGMGDYTSNSSAPWCANKYKDSILIAEINISGMKKAKGMFRNCRNLVSLEIKNFDTRNIMDMSDMFYGCNSLVNLDVSNFDTINVEDMSRMFYGCNSLANLDVSGFDTDKVKNMRDMFFECRSLKNLDVSNFDTSNVTSMLSMFYGCSSLSNLDVRNFNTSNVIDMGGMFGRCGNLVDLNINNFSTNNVTNMGGMFNCCYNLNSLNLSNFDTENVESMFGMFGGCRSLVSVEINSFNTSNVTNMGMMFYECNSLSSLEISNFDTSNVTNMECMFAMYKHLKSNLVNLDLSNFNTCKVTDMRQMFENCNSLSSLDVGSFDTGNVTDMKYMFSDCSSLSSLDVGNFNTCNVIDMSCMFYECNGLNNLDLSNFNTSKVTVMDEMFANCNRLNSLDVSSFDMSNVIINFSKWWIWECGSLTTIYTPYNVSMEILLPGYTWYRSDGTVVTELPQNVSYSVALGKNYIPQEKITESTVIELKDGQSAVFTYDTATNQLIADAAVTIDGSTYLTNSDGIAVFTAPAASEKKQILVTASGYNDVSTYQQIKSKNVVRIGLEPQKASLQITSVTGSLGDNTYDFLREKLVLGYAQDTSEFTDVTETPLKLSVIANKINVKYEIISTSNYLGGSSGGGGFGDDDTKVLFTSTNGKFSINVITQTIKNLITENTQTAITNFVEPGKKLYVRVTDSDGNEAIKRLNITTTYNYPSKEMASQKDSFKLGNEIKVSVPEDVPFIGGNDYVFGFEDEMPVEVEIDEDGKIKISLNKPADIDMERYSSEYKHLEKKAETAVKHLAGSTSFGAGMFAVSGKVCGYGEGNINEIFDGNPTIKLGVIGEITGKAGYKQYWIIGFIPVNLFIEGSVTGKVSAKAEMKFENWKIKEFDMSGGSFNVTVQLEAGGGIGFGYEIEASLIGKLNYTNKPARQHEKLWLEASGKVKRVIIGIWEKTLWESDTYQYTLYQRGTDTPNPFTYDFMPDSRDEAGAAAFSVVGRTYLNHTDGYHAFADQMGISAYAADAGNENIIVKSAVFPTASPTLITAGNVKYLFWLDDIPSRDAYNRTALMYTKSANGTDWSTPKQLAAEADDNTLDGAYDIFVNDGKIYVTWQDAVRQLTDSDDVLSAAKSLTIRYAVLDTVEDTVIENKCLTEETGYYMYPSTVAAGDEVYFAYVQNMLNEENLDANNTQKLYVVSGNGETKETAIPAGTQIVNMDAGVFAGRPSLACELDMDGDASTDQDREIYVYDFSAESLSRITDNGVPDTMPVIADSGKLYWFQDTEIVKFEETGKTPVAIWNEPQMAYQTVFSVATDTAGRDTILWEAVDTDAEDGSVAIFQTSENEDGSWSGVVKFAETTGTISSRISAAGSGKDLQVAHTEGVFMEDGTALKDLCVTAKEAKVDIAVGYVDFTEEDAAAGNPLVLRTEVTNNGNATVNEITVSVDDAVVATLTGLDLKPSESRELEISGFSVPASLKETTNFTLKLEAPGEENREDNTAGFLLGCPDVYVETDCRISNERTWLDINVGNNTMYEASGKVIVHKASEDGKVIYSKAYSGLGGQTGYAYSIDLGDYEDKDVKYYVEVTSDREENFLGNNTEFVYIGYGTGVVGEEGEQTVPEVNALLLDQTALSLGIGSTAQLSAKDDKGNPFKDGELLWSSSDNRIASVDQNGFVKAHRAGIAEITAYYGELSCICRIAVGEGADSQNLTVWFDTQGGEEIAPMTGILFGSTIKLPTNVRKEGYIFEGWYTQPTGGEKVNGDTLLVEKTMTLYAHWKSAQSENQEEEDDYAGVLPEDIPEGGIPAGLWIAGIDEQGYPYTGQQVKPKVRVYDTDKRLKEGQDYTVSYKNNTRANDASGASKAPTITVKGKGNYGGKETATFKILPVDLNDTSVITEDIVTAYNKKVQKKVPALTYNGKKLAKNKDFTVSYPALEKGTNDAYKAIGTYDIVLTAKAGGNYTGTRIVKLTITDSILLSRVSVKKIPNQAYTGDAIEPEPTVTYKKTPLVKGTDYTVSYTNNTSAGTATVVLTGIGKYAGTKKITFKITGISLKKAEVSGIQDTIYDGTAQKQNIMVVAEHKILEEGTDYEVVYANNINAGKASITIKGKGGYTGTIKKTFRIEACYLLEEMGLQGEITAKYVKGGSRPKVELVFAGKKLKEGRDYTVSYQNNKAVTTAEVKKKPSITVRGKGNFKGTKIKYFTIINKALDDAEFPVTITVSDKAVSDKAGKYKSAPFLTDADGKKLTAGKDYEKEIIYSLEDGTQLTNKSKVGVGTSIKVKVTGKGAYYGELESVYCITERDFTKTKISIVPQIYTGSEITLDEEDITVKIGKDTLKFNTDYEIVETSYVGNIKKGMAKVTIKGKGSYGGMKTVKFRITAKNFAWFWRMFG